MNLIDLYLFRKKHSSNYNKKRLFPFILSILLHGICLLIFTIIKFELIDYSKDNYSTIILIEKYPDQSVPKNEIKLKSERDIMVQQNREELNINDSLVLEIVPHVVSDTSDKDVFISQTELADSNENLKFARSLLDTFLILHPEYNSYILSELSKKMEENPDDKKSFSRADLEKKINDELHKYISEKFPQGSQYEINKYTGPGVNIPIGDLIDIIRSIF